MKLQLVKGAGKRQLTREERLLAEFRDLQRRFDALEKLIFSLVQQPPTAA